MARPKFVLAAELEVPPVPPSDTAKVPVIELASNLRANSVDSITSPPFALRSTDNSAPDLSSPSPAVTSPLELN